MEAKNPIVWFEIYVDELNRAQKFYETVLDVELTILQTPDKSEADSGLKMIAFPMAMNGAGASGALVKMEGVKSGGNSTIVYFASEDCSTEEVRIENAGGKIFKPKMSIGEYGFITLFYDTEGNMVGLHSMS